MVKKILALLLIVVMAVSVLASCGANSDELNLQIIEAAESVLKGGAYCATTKITYASAYEGDDLAEEIENVTSSQIIYSVNGDDFNAFMNVEVNGNMVEQFYVVKDGVLYVRSNATIAGNEIVIKEKAELDETAMADVLAEIGPGVELGYADFEVHEGTGSLESSTITCANLKEESLMGVEKILKAAFAGDNTQFTLSGATLVLEIKDGKYNKTSLTLNCIAMVNGYVYKLNVTMETTYDFLSDVSISAPSDAYEYGLVDYENIFN